MQPFTPSPDHPVWGPPHIPVTTQAARPTTPAQAGRAAAAGHRHPAARARRLVGWATIASSAAIVGYMVTASADQPSSQPAAVTPTLPSVQTPPVARQQTDDEATPAPVAVSPLPGPVRQAPPANAARPSQQGRPNSSSHGS